jgi:hypothetical protein
MTLAPMNEAIRHENCVKKNLNKEKNYRNDRVVMQDTRIVVPSKKRKIL